MSGTTGDVAGSTGSAPVVADAKKRCGERAGISAGRWLELGGLVATTAGALRRSAAA